MRRNIGGCDATTSAVPSPLRAHDAGNMSTGTFSWASFCARCYSYYPPRTYGHGVSRRPTSLRKRTNSCGEHRRALPHIWRCSPRRREGCGLQIISMNSAATRRVHPAHAVDIRSPPKLRCHSLDAYCWPSGLRQPHAAIPQLETEMPPRTAAEQSGGVRSGGGDVPRTTRPAARTERGTYPERPYKLIPRAAV